MHPHPQSGGKPAPCEGKQKELGKGQEELRERQEDAPGGDEEEPQGGKEGLTLWNGATHPRQLWGNAQGGALAVFVVTNGTAGTGTGC